MTDDPENSDATDEGVTKYQCVWTPAPPPQGNAAQQLIACRDRLHELGLVGVYPPGVGFGNVSVRSSAGRFLITGTQTGHLSHLTPLHLSEVVGYSIEDNQVTCQGPVAASSEALTHAALYELGREVGAVVHVHHRGMWNHYRSQKPTTPADVAYGTVEMAQAMRCLWNETDLSTQRVIVMAGHEDGLISVGADVEQATARIVELHHLWCRR